MNKAWSSSKNRGFSIAEVVVSASIVSLLVASLGGAFLVLDKGMAAEADRRQAVSLAEEALEAARNIRDESFSNLAPGIYGLAVVSQQYQLAGSYDGQGKFFRQLAVGEHSSGGRTLSSTVSWQSLSGATSTVSLSSLLTGWQGGAELGDWSSSTVASLYNASGGNDAVDLALAGNLAYVVRDGGSLDFLILDISDPENPVLLGSLNLPGTPFGIAVMGGYAYIANNSNSQELQIVDVSNPAAPVLAASYNAPGNSDANKVFASGSYVYFTRDSSSSDELVILDVSVPASPSFEGSLDLAATAHRLQLEGGYIYVATEHNSQELQIVDVSNPAAPVLAASYNLPGNSDGLSVAVAGGLAFAGNSSGYLAVLDVSNPVSPALLGSYSSNGDIFDIEPRFGGGVLFLATSDNDQEFQAVSISDPAAPALLGSYNFFTAGDLLGVAYSQASDLVVAVGQADPQEVIILIPQ